MRRSCTIVALAAAACLAVPARAESYYKYDPAKLENPAKFAGEAEDYFDPEGFEDVKNAAPKKLAVSEFVVEFVTQSQGGAFSGGIGSLMGAGKKNFEFTDEMKAKLVENLYQSFVAQVAAKGIEVLPKDELLAAPAYADLAGGVDPVSKRAWTGKSAGGRAASKLDVVPAAGMKMLPTKGEGEELNDQNEARMIEALGIDGTLKAKIRISLYKGKYPAIDLGTVVAYRLGVNKKTDKKSGATVYGPRDWGEVEMEAGLYLEDDVTTGKDFQAGKGTEVTFDSDRFTQGIEKLGTKAFEMAAVGMK